MIGHILAVMSTLLIAIAAVISMFLIAIVVFLILRSLATDDSTPMAVTKCRRCGAVLYRYDSCPWCEDR